jgi:hypothetical protein
MKKPLQIAPVGLTIEGGFGVSSTDTTALTAIARITARTIPSDGARVVRTRPDDAPPPGLLGPPRPPGALGPPGLLGGRGGAGTRGAGVGAITEL